MLMAQNSICAEIIRTVRHYVPFVDIMRQCKTKEAEDSSGHDQFTVATL